jgi:hypothetical protein
MAKDPATGSETDRLRQYQAIQQAKRRQEPPSGATKHQGQPDREGTQWTTPLAQSVEAMFGEALEASLALDDIQHALISSPLDTEALRSRLREDRPAILLRTAIGQQQWEEAWQQSHEPPSLSETERAGDTWVFGMGIAITTIAVLGFVGALVMLAVGYLVGALTPAVRGLQGPARLTLAIALSSFGGGLLVFALDTYLRRLHDRRAKRAKVEAAMQREAVRRRSWRDSLEQGIVAEATARINDSVGPSYDLRLRVKNPLGLNEMYDDAHRITTRAAELLNELMGQLPGGSVGLAGPRGVGKTTLIRSYCPETLSGPNAGESIAFMVAAPVQYDARDFLYHLFAALCRRYLEARQQPSVFAPAGLPNAARLWLPFLPRRGRRPITDALADQARHHLAALRYLQTHTTTLGAKATLGVAEPSWQAATASTQQPLPYPETVAEFRQFVRAVAQEVHGRGGSMVIGIDELDKMSSADQAYRFLNELKTVFGIPYCYFLVAVSEDALTEFEMRGLPIRTAFDSTFDAVIPVDYLPFERSRELLRKRVIGMSEPFLALCHCLSGGLPRDLIRVCRGMVAKGNGDGGAIALATVCQAMIADEVAAKAQAVRTTLARTRLVHTTGELLNRVRSMAQRPFVVEELWEVFKQLHEQSPSWLVADDKLPDGGTVSGVLVDFTGYLYFCLTLVDFFDSKLDEQRMQIATNPSTGAASVDALASARQAFALGAYHAWYGIAGFRAGWHLDPSLAYPGA